VNTTARRPGGVTLIAVLTWLGGALDVIGGIALLFNHDSLTLRADWGGESSLITVAIVSILLGIVVLLVARGLLRGSAGARVLVTIVQLLAIVGYAITAFLVPVDFALNAIGALVSLIVIILLWTGRASDFFRSR
jgi:hypothetical protein